MHPLARIGNSSVHRPVARQRDHEPSDQAASLSRHNDGNLVIVKSSLNPYLSIRKSYLFFS
jgi:hypothetical protein